MEGVEGVAQVELYEVSFFTVVELVAYEVSQRRQGSLAATVAAEPVLGVGQVAGALQEVEELLVHNAFECAADDRRY